MIKNVMVWLEGRISDEIRLAAVAEIARRLGSEVVIGLFLNPLPLPGPVDGDISGALATAELMTRVREVGDKTEALLPGDSHNLSGQSGFGGSMCGADDIANIAAREARSAYTFVALRPNGAMDPERLVEGVLLGSGRRVFLVPEVERPKIAFDRILVAWNAAGSRPEPWPKPCHFYTGRMRLRSWS
jgi:hypothetical protein